jgi:hypothetical protein
MPVVLITGDRNWRCTQVAARVLDSLAGRHGDNLELILGDCPSGVDRTFRNGCIMRKIKYREFVAHWDLYGKAAGPIRNAAMADSGADYAIAVHRNIERSRGTKDCVKRCFECNVPVYLIDGTNPDRKLTVEDLR